MSAGNTPPATSQRISYNTIRDQFLANPPKDGGEDAKYFAEIGLFVFDRWQQIAADVAPGEDLDEDGSDARWDECTEKDLESFKQQAAIMVGNVAKKQGAVAFANQLWTKHVGWMVAAHVVAWIAKTVASAIVGAVGLILVGSLILSLAPPVAQAVRSTLDDFLPVAEETQSDTSDSDADEKNGS